MTTARWLIIFSLDESRYALYLTAVERIELAATVTKLPKAPDIVTGLINIRGTIIPVVNVRKRFSHPDQDLYLSNQFIIARTSSRLVGLIVDNVHGVVEYPTSAITPTENIASGIDYFKGIMKLNDGIVLIHDLDTFLSLEEQSTLDLAMAQRDNNNATPAY